MKLKITRIIVFSLLISLSSCTNSGDKEEMIIEYCNNKSKNLAEYAKCRCQKLTNSKSYTKEMDDCMVDKETYSKGYKGTD